MENSISGQLALAGWALGLGLSWGLLYDLLRPLRRHCRKGWQQQGLDALFCLSCALWLIRFALRCGGELRLYMLAATALGLLLYLLLAAPLLGEVWGLLAESLWETAAVLLLPGKVFHSWVKKAGKLFKKHFHFYVKCYIIKHSRHSAAAGKGPSRGRSAVWRRKKAKSGPAR